MIVDEPADRTLTVPATMAVALAIVTEKHGANDPAVIADLLAEPQPDAWHREALTLAMDTYEWQTREYGPEALHRNGIRLARIRCGLEDP